MQHVEVIRHFPASPQAVWDAYTDHTRWSEWAGVPRSWLEVEGAQDRNGTGAVRGLGSGVFAAFEEILDFEPPKRMTYRIVRGALPMRNHLGEVRLEPEGDGTRLVWGCQFDARIPGLGPLLRVGVTRFFKRALEGLARHSFS